jgi:hypothetical protein
MCHPAADARDKMDRILSSESAWAEVTGNEELKITEAAEAFLTLLHTMTDRYSILPQPGHRYVGEGWPRGGGN